VVAFWLPLAAGCGEGNGGTDRRELLLASTTSTQDSGLLDVLIPAFEEETGYSVKLVSGGSGQAIENGRRGDVDVLLVHSPDAEKGMVADSDGIERAPVMHNDFVIVGPPGDGAGVRGTGSPAAAMRAIAGAGAPFISRGDDSGTHVLERKLWVAAGIEPRGERWYEESGQGQGATLQIASQKGAYAATDRATFLVQRNNLDLEIAFEGDPALLNVYHVIVVNPDKHRDVNVAAARAWGGFVTGEAGQRLIGEFGAKEYGEPLFVPDAGKPEPGGG
jgi:tungstate transport system substrate-binding protein